MNIEDCVVGWFSNLSFQSTGTTNIHYFFFKPLADLISSTMKTSAVIFMAFFVAKFSVSATFPNAGNEF